MSYCQKCIDAIRIDILKNDMTVYPLGEQVPESECEFWAHQAYNRVRNILKAGIEDMGKEIPP